MKGETDLELAGPEGEAVAQASDYTVFLKRGDDAAATRRGKAGRRTNNVFRKLLASHQRGKWGGRGVGVCGAILCTPSGARGARIAALD